MIPPMTIREAILWANDNQALVALAFGAAAGAFNWACKPRTQEQYDAMPPRAAAFFRASSALFPDAYKLTESIWQFWNNTRDRMKP
jgi:hypothetical protein